MASSATAVQKVTEQEAYEIGKEAYLYFYPLLTMEVTRKQMTNLPAGKKPGFGPENVFSHTRAYPDADFKAVVRPNFDTLYSSAWLNLSDEPMIVSLPDTNGRYYLLPILDMWTDVLAAPGWRTSGTAAQNYALVPPGWSGNLPQNVERIDVTTTRLWIIGRTKTDGPSDYATVHDLQDAMKITPLSMWGGTAPPLEATIDDTVDMVTAPLETVNSMSVQTYFSRAAQLLATYRPHSTDWSLISRVRRMGIVEGQPVDLSKLDDKIAKAFELGAKDALKTMLEKLNSVGKQVNGWSMNTDSMGVYGNYYLKRAIVAMAGLGANQAEDAIYPLNYADADGQPLSGDKNYVLRFEKNELPPVNAFWSVTMYDANGFQTANELNRFAISSWMPLKADDDGSLTIYIQHKNPGPAKEANWLPSPASGVLGLTMRLYAPKEQALYGDWNPPSIQKQP